MTSTGETLPVARSVSPATFVAYRVDKLGIVIAGFAVAFVFGRPGFSVPTPEAVLQRAPAGYARKP